MYRDDHAQIKAWGSGTVGFAEIVHKLVRDEQRRRLREQYEKLRKEC